MHSTLSKGLVWFRRDLRTFDNAALARALSTCGVVYCVFVFDKTILDSLPAQDRRVEFIHDAVHDLAAALQDLGQLRQSPLIVLHAASVDAIPDLALQLDVQAVFAARDYEPAAVARDLAVQQALLKQNRQLVLLKDQVIFEEREILTQTGKPYGVFTPYHRAWLARCSAEHTHAHSVSAVEAARLTAPPGANTAIPSLEELGFKGTNLHSLGIRGGEKAGANVLELFLPRLAQYADTRNFPGIKGPSYLGVHLRFGTVSIRHLVRLAMDQMQSGSEGAATWLSELVWREFYFQILSNFPHVVDGGFKPEYDAIVWESGDSAQEQFHAWCEGRTGYPIVDAAMAQLNQTGYMHNRLRMVAGSFLVKHLGIDWRWGERYFALKLNDFDLSANNGGWQWVASSGCDAQPYFRIFNPVTQSEKFDGEGKFIKRYLPQLAGLPAKALHAPWLAKPMELAAAGVRLGDNYPERIVVHEEARARTLARYGFLKKTAAPQAGTSE